LFIYVKKLPDKSTTWRVLTVRLSAMLLSIVHRCAEKSGGLFGGLGLLGLGAFCSRGAFKEKLMLTDKFIKALKPGEKPRKVADGGGLSLRG
jgi:hypothetical protein